MKEINLDSISYDGSPEQFLNWKKRINLKFTSVGFGYLLIDPQIREIQEKKKEEEEELAQATAAIKLTLSNKPEIDTEMCQTPYEIINILSSKFQSITKMSLFRELSEFTRLKLNENEDALEWLKSFNAKKEKLRQCGFDKSMNPDDFFKTYLLSALPSSYDSMVGGITNNLADETYEEIHNKVLNKIILTKSNQNQYPVANIISSEKKLCSSCKKNHFGPCATECPKCRKKHYGHFKCNTVVNVINKENIPNYLWCIDSGANVSVSNSVGNFKTISASSGDIGVACNDGSLTINGIGEVHLHTKSGKSIQLCNVLYSSNAARNILSVSDITKIGLNVLFTNSGWKIINSDKSVFLSGTIQDGLYILETSNPQVNSLIRSSTYDVWHNRLGHPGKTTMKKIKQVCQSELRNMTINDDVCKICVEGKGAKLPHNKKAVKASKPFIRIHSDIWGPSSKPDWQGNRYYVSFTDDFSGYATIFLMKDKSEVEKHYLAYSRHIKNLNNGVSITFLRSDNGMEYKSSTFKSILMLDGTKREFSAPYCQQENGTSERLNRSLLEKTRCIMFESKCPIYLWGDAIKTACYIYNRIPQAKRGASPYELWFNNKLELKHMKIFGSIAYANIPVKITGGKFNRRAKSGRMIGYSSESKSYILWDEEKRTQHESRDVIFEESDHKFKSGKSIEKLRKENNAKLVKSMPTPSPRKVTDSESSENSESESDSDDNTSESSFDNGSEYEETDKENKRNTDKIEYEKKEKENNNSTSWLNNLNPFRLLKDESETESESDIEDSKELDVDKENEPIVEKEPRRSTRATIPTKRFWETNTIMNDTSTPQTFEQAMLNPDAKKWEAAMSRESQSLQDAQSWTLVEKPAGRKIIGGRWVYTKKLNPDGSVNIYKARYCAKGYTQIENVDYKEIFSPVMKFTSLRTILAIATKEDWDVEQMDVTTAFLNGTLEEDLYLQQPKGQEVKGKETWVCKLHKSIYGLKQAPRVWNSTLNNFLVRLGFVSSDADPCIYIWKNGKNTVIVGVYVDDLAITGDTRKYIEWIKTEFEQRFKMKDMGPVKFILGIEIERNRKLRTMKLHQNAYALKKINEFGMEILGKASTPTEIGLNLDSEDSPLLGNDNLYRQAVGSLLYLSNCTRPDLSFSVGVLSRYLCSPREVHWKAVQRTFQYLNQSSNCGIVFKDTGVIELVSYSDSDYAGDIKTRKSTSGSINLLCSGPISWKSNRQRVVAKCTMEAEYIALSDNGSEVIWLRQLLSDLGYKQNTTTINEDNAACISIANNPTNHHRAKHIDIRYHWIRQEIQNKTIKLQKCPSKLMLADILTKPLNRFLFKDLGTRCGITVICLGGSVE